jgi:2-polyprenyl-3-methyl-5-hydroxy-6-metoxy-1,4-benzoquinol methylase
MNLFRKPANLKKATHSEQEKLWNARSDEDYISVINNFERMAEPFPDVARRALNAMSSDRIIDLAFGYGATSLFFVRAGAKIEGIDISEK